MHSHSQEGRESCISSVVSSHVHHRALKKWENMNEPRYECGDVHTEEERQLKSVAEEDEQQDQNETMRDVCVCVCIYRV